VPERIAYLFIVCACVLSALGFDAWLALARRRPWVAAGSGALLLGAGLLVADRLAAVYRQPGTDPALHALQGTALRQAALIAGSLLIWASALVILRGDRRWWGRATLAGLLLGTTVVDLLTYAPGYNTYVTPERLIPQARAVEVISTDSGLWRIMAPDAPNPMFPPNVAALYGLPDVQGYDSLTLKRYIDFWASVDTTAGQTNYFNVMVRPQNYFRGLADLLNVKYITTWAPLGDERQMDVRGAAVEVGAAPLAQSLRAPQRLTSIDIAFDTGGRRPRAPITLRVRRGMAETPDLVTQTIDPAAWTGQPWIAFTFPPLDVAKGDPLVFILEAPAAHPGQGVRVRASQGEKYRYGAAYQAGQWREWDLAFIARGALPDKLERVYDSDVAVYVNHAALPRAFTVAGAEVLTPTAMLERLGERTFDPRQAVLLEQPPPAAFGMTTGDGLPPGTATITRYRNLSVELTAQMARPGWLVLGDVNYPGWQVEVDGRPAPLYTAYYILRAVPLPAGDHQVRFVFRPASVAIGGIISTGALLAALVVLGASPLGRHLRARRQVL
jgi:hypothetical protein